MNHNRFFKVAVRNITFKKLIGSNLSTKSDNSIEFHQIGGVHKEAITARMLKLLFCEDSYLNSSYFVTFYQITNLAPCRPPYLSQVPQVSLHEAVLENIPAPSFNR